MKRSIIIALVITLIAPSFVRAAVLCSDGSPAPADNICNCATSASISGSNFTPGTGSTLTGNTYTGMNFSGVGGALLSCLNVGGSISNAVGSLFGQQDTSGATDAASEAQSIKVANQAINNNTKNTKQELSKANQREQCLNGAAYSVAKSALQKLSDKTLNWIKSGFNGNPFYVRDTTSYMNSIRNEVLDDYLNNGATRQNRTFGNTLRSVIRRQTTGWDDGLANKVMNTPEAQQYEQFQNDFTQGGWDSFLNMDNNPVGAYFDEVDQLSDQINEKKSNTKQELAQGNGFLSMKKCVEYANNNQGGSTSCQDNLEAQAQQQYADCMALAASGQSQQDQAASEQICQTALSAAEAQAAQDCGTSTTPSAPSSSAKCVRYETVTPGTVIADQAKSILGSTATQLINADSINEVLGSFFDELMNRLFNDGLSGSGNGRGGINTLPGGYGANIVTSTSGQTLTAANACQTPLGYNATTGGFNGEFDISRPQQLRAIIKTQKQFLIRAQDAQFKMRQFVPRLGALDYCMPGPNPSFNNTLNENGQAFVNSLVQITHTQQASAGSTVLGALDIGGIASGLNCAAGGILGPCNASTIIDGYVFHDLHLFDKVDNGQKKISDRLYSATGVSQDVISRFFSAVFEQLKTAYNTTYTDAALINAFATIPNVSPAQQTINIADAKESIKETGNLIGYAQGVASYDQYYTKSIQDTQDAITELEEINTEVEQIVATAKARYINEHNQPGQTPINISCIDNAYQVDTAPVQAGITHYETITAPLDWFQVQSAASNTYFYSRL